MFADYNHVGTTTKQMKQVTAKMKYLYRAWSYQVMPWVCIIFSLLLIK